MPVPFVGLFAGAAYVLFADPGFPEFHAQRTDGGTIGQLVVSIGPAVDTAMARLWRLLRDWCATPVSNQSLWASLWMRAGSNVVLPGDRGRA